MGACYEGQTNPRRLDGESDVPIEKKNANLVRVLIVVVLKEEAMDEKMCIGMWIAKTR